MNLNYSFQNSKKITKMINSKYIYVSSIFLFTIVFNSVSFAQLSVPFKMRFQDFVKGDMSVIANNITNRVDISNSSNVAYYNQTNTAQLNDEFTMQYIDIDNDNSTFSSSSAELILENSKNKKIVYAGLYWSATYKYNSGYQKKQGKFVADDKERELFNEVKIKLPNQDDYTSIIGEILYDGIKDKELKEFAPYVVYANVTKLVKELKNPSGIYTVANIKATQGMLSGGVASGWTLFFVYEDEKMSGKFITSFDGFASVTDRSTDILFNGFETLPKGNVNAKIACAALEGDSNMMGDQLLFNTTGNFRDFVPLTNSVRKTNNFFNSSITIEDKFFSKRIPDSKNTLGYDTCLISIPNENNEVIGNNSNQATLRLKSSGDRYMMFFTAFNVEVTEEAVKLKKANKDLIVSSKIESKEVTINKIDKGITEKKIIKKEEVSETEPVVLNEKESKEIQKTKAKEEKKLLALQKKEEKRLKKALEKAEKENQKMLADAEKSRLKQIKKERKNKNKDSEIAKIEILDISVDNLEKGYYIVANVFEKPYNAINFIKFLKEKGIEAKFFINKENNYRYVYISKTDSEKDAINLYQSKVNNTYQDQIWILSVNKKNNNLQLTNNDY